MKEIFVKSSSVRVSTVYDTYWKFAFERQNIFLRRLNGEEAPWTNDPILLEYKFTNAFRASDRVSQFLIKNVIYSGSKNIEDVMFKTLLFKIFNRIDTWQLIENLLKQITFKSFDIKKVSDALDRAMSSGSKIYSAAYIMPSGVTVFGMKRKHHTHLKLLGLMMKEELPKKLLDCKNMKNAYEVLLSYPTIGPFLAYQFITDLNYTEFLKFSEMEFTVPGPGAKNGIRKCFIDSPFPEEDMIKFMTDNQHKEFERLGLNFKNLFGRDLHLIDCQNLFCEVDKYSRVKHPEIAGVNDRSRIKQRFNINNEKILYWYPPKWGINQNIPRQEKNCSLPTLF